MNTDFQDWYCCINPTERTILDLSLAAFIAELGQPIPRAAWDVLWIPVVQSSEARRRAFLSIYGMFETEIIIDPETPPIPAYGWDEPLTWAALAAFMILPAAGCPDGCTQVVFP